MEVQVKYQVNAGRVEDCNVYQCGHAPREVRGTMKAWICQECHDKYDAEVDQRWEKTLASITSSASDCHLIIDGKYYIECGWEENKAAYLLGFNGQVFNIERFDGTIVKTNNLWYHGVVPVRWRFQLPDNARFV